MIKSMTAFARTEKTTQTQSLTMEMRSLNSRYLDIVLRMTHGYLLLEDRIKKQINQSASRGRIEVSINIKEDALETEMFEVDWPKAKAYFNSLEQIKEQFNLNDDISLRLLLGTAGIIKPAEIEKDADATWPLIEECLSELLANLNAMRLKEGQAIANDFIVRLNIIEKHLQVIEGANTDLLGQYQERLKNRIAELTNGVIEIDPVRIAQEAAFLANRSDVSEEIVRAKSHIKQFREILNSDEAVGRQLNFLLQEMGREFNTVGSKTDNIEVSQAVVSVKTELEKIREQVQNVE